MEKAWLVVASILIGMMVGYIVCIPLGMVDFKSVSDASWFAVPNILEYGIIFDWKAVLAFIPAYFVTTIETVGCLKAIGETSNVEMTEKKNRSWNFSRWFRKYLWRISRIIFLIRHSVKMLV